jgi:tRNA A-37 threonylcarbamoyl transferase component Bud32
MPDQSPQQPFSSHWPLGQDSKATGSYVPQAANPDAIPTLPLPPPAGEAPTMTQVPGAAPPLLDPLLAKVKIPGYEILSVLGRGGMGVVYKARQTNLKRLVALKMNLAGIHASPTERARFRTEAETIAQLQHPNIVQIYAVDEHEGKPFLALEYVEGGNLAQELKGKPWNARLAATMLLQLADALRVVHEHGVVHRDLKPANVLLTLDGEPKITDFGLAKQLDASMGRTASGAIMGTPAYMSPEQAEGKNKKLGPTTDIYSLGAILYELLTGRPPFQGDAPLDTIIKVISEEVVPPRQLRPNLPPDIETICMRCLQKKPEDRYPSAAALAEDLRRFQNDEPLTGKKEADVLALFRYRPLEKVFWVLLTVYLFAVLLTDLVQGNWLGVPLLCLGGAICLKPNRYVLTGGLTAGFLMICVSLVIGWWGARAQRDDPNIVPFERGETTKVWSERLNKIRQQRMERMFFTKYEKTKMPQAEAEVTLAQRVWETLFPVLRVLFILGIGCAIAWLMGGGRRGHWCFGRLYPGFPRAVGRNHAAVGHPRRAGDPHGRLCRGPDAVLDGRTTSAARLFRLAGKWPAIQTAGSQYVGRTVRSGLSAQGISTQCRGQRRHGDMATFAAFCPGNWVGAGRGGGSSGQSPRRPCPASPFPGLAAGARQRSGSPGGHRGRDRPVYSLDRSRGAALGCPTKRDQSQLPLPLRQDGEVAQSPPGVCPYPWFAPTPGNLLQRRQAAPQLARRSVTLSGPS